MADYRVVDKEQLDAGLTIIADAIREKGGITADLEFPNEMRSAVLSIETGADTTVEHPAEEEDIVDGKEAWVNGELITGINPYKMEETDNEVETQKDLISQIRTTIINKTAMPDTTVDNPAEESDIVAGKEAWVNGEKVEGIIPVQEAGTFPEEWEMLSDAHWGDDEIVVEFNVNKERLARKNSGGYVSVSADILGDAKPEDVVSGKTFSSLESGLKNEGMLEKKYWFNATASLEDGELLLTTELDKKYYVDEGISSCVSSERLGDAKPEDVRAGVYFTSENGLKIPGTALLPGGGGFVYPDGAFAPVTSFTDGKQYALVALIDGVYRYIDTTDNPNSSQYTMSAPQITISEDTGDYVIFSSTPALFTAVASGNGFLLQNGSNYLHGSTSNGTALRVGTTQAVWTVDNSETGGFSDGKYFTKEDVNAVWLKSNDGSYDWSIKFETSSGGFGYDRNGRDNTYSAEFTSFILYEYVAGEGDANPIMDTSEGNLSANKMLEGAIGFSNGRKVEGNIKSQGAQTITPSTTENYIEPGVYLSGRQTIAAIQTETGSATQSGTYYPSNGKYFSSFSVNTPVGYVIKTGTQTGGTSAGSVNTGLSKIKEFFIYKESVRSTGLINLHYSDASGTSYIYASQWSTSSMIGSGTKTITAGTGSATVGGGTLTFPSTTATSGGLTASTTYTWVAIGEE